MALDVSADQERLLFSYELPEKLPAPASLLLSRTEFSSMWIDSSPEALSSELHVHTDVDQSWFIVEGSMTFTGEKGELIGEIGAEQGIVIPRGHAFSADVTPSAERGRFEAYRFVAADRPMTESDHDELWLAGPKAVPEGLAALDSIEKSPHAPAVFSHPRPVVTHGKALDFMAMTDRGIFAFQVLKDGGETNMHSHDHLEGFWFVRRGKARFYTGGAEENVVLAELGPNQGVLIPRSYPYWFEAIIESDDDECEILQFEACDFRLAGKKDLTSDRNDYVPPKPSQFLTQSRDHS